MHDDNIYAYTAHNLRRGLELGIEPVRGHYFLPPNQWENIACKACAVGLMAAGVTGVLKRGPITRARYEVLYNRRPGTVLGKLVEDIEYAFECSTPTLTPYEAIVNILAWLDTEAIEHEKRKAKGRVPEAGSGRQPGGREDDLRGHGERSPVHEPALAR